MASSQVCFAVNVVQTMRGKKAVGEAEAAAVVLNRPWYSEALCDWHYWLSALGMLLMFLVLMIAGLFQGQSWSSLEMWDESIRLSIPFWWVHHLRPVRVSDHADHAGP
jgi:hypothetical protein